MKNSKNLLTLPQNREAKEQLHTLLMEKTRRRCLESYYEFFKVFWGEIESDHLVDNWHIKYLCDAVQGVGERVIARKPKTHDLVINLAPSESKSTIVLKLFHAWLLARDPTLKLLGSSLNEKLAMGLMAITKDCMKSKLYRDLFPNTKIRGDFDAKRLFKTTEGGMRAFCTVGSSPIGTHYHLIGADDLVKWGASSAELRLAKEHLSETLPTRTTDRKLTPIILVMQRIAQDDPTDVMLNFPNEVKHICLPATNELGNIEPPECENFYTDGLMNPTRTDRLDLDGFRKKGARAFAAQFLQSPRTLDGNLIKEEYLPIVSMNDIPVRVLRAKYQGVADLAQGKSAMHDSSGALFFKQYKNIIYIFHFEKYKTDTVTNGERLLALTQRFSNNTRPCKIHIENKGGGKNMVESLVAAYGIPAISYKVPNRGKLERLVDVLPHLEASQVYLVKGAWNEAFIDECLVFPNGRADEAVDCLTMAIDIGITGNLKKYIKKNKGGGLRGFVPMVRRF